MIRSIFNTLHPSRNNNPDILLQETEIVGVVFERSTFAIKF